MKILYIVSTLKRSGPTYQLLNTVKFLNRTMFKPIILTLSLESKDSLINEFELLDIKIYSENVGYNVLNLIKMKKIIEKIKPDVIHSSGIRGDFINSLLKNQSNISVSTIHNNMTKDYLYRYGKLLGSIMIFIHMKSLKKLKFPVTCSESIKGEYKKTFNFNTISIPNGINQNNFDQISTEQKENLRKKFDINNNTKVFISVGHLTKLKDPELICKAFVNVNKENSMLIFLGDGELYGKLESQYDNLSNIKFLGRVKNVNEYLSISDYFISASHTEGLPNAVLEAMSSNLRVILSDIEPHKELVVNKAKIEDFYLFEKGNVESLANVFKSILENDSCSTGNYCENRKIVDLYYTAEIMSNKYQNLYQKIKGGM